MKKRSPALFVIRGNTVDYEQSRRAIERRAVIIGRLEKAEIDIKDLADLIWAELEPALEKKVERLALEALGNALKDLRLTSFITGSNIQ